MKTVILNNGIEMPLMGYGVWQIAPEKCEHYVSEALKAGYRLIDTAQAYYNEEGVGQPFPTQAFRVRKYSSPRKYGFPMPEMKRLPSV